MSKLRLITTPYSFEGKLFKAYDEIFQLVNDSDWVCFMDGDIAFLEMSDFGHVMQEYIDKYPETGMFTCYATRCHYVNQTRRGVNQESDSIDYYAQMTIKTRKELHLSCKNIDRRIAGHLIMMQKSTWNMICEELNHKCVSKNKHILGFDTQLSNTILESGMDIKLMRGVLVFHYLRKLTGKNKKIK